MNSGVPPTARNARTGELTPPGMARRARSNSAMDWVGDSAGRGFPLGVLIGISFRWMRKYAPLLAGARVVTWWRPASRRQRVRAAALSRVARRDSLRRAARRRSALRA